MITLQYLKAALADFAEVTNADEQVIESDAGYDGIVALINERPQVNPVVILEPSEVFSLGVNPGGIEHSSKNIWVVDMVGATENRYDVQLRANNLMRKVIAKLIQLSKTTDDLDGWQWENIPVMTFNGGPSYTGFVFTMYFTEDINLTFSQYSTTDGGTGD